jgi:hypothetical protein
MNHIRVTMGITGINLANLVSGALKASLLAACLQTKLRLLP